MCFNVEQGLLKLNTYNDYLHHNNTLLMKKLFSALALLCFIIFGLTLYFVQQVVAFTPDTEMQVSEWRKLNRFDAFDWPVQEISFEIFTNSIAATGEKFTLRGVFIASEQENAPTVIALHGKGSNRIGVLKFGYLFHQAGFNVLIYDQRHHGRSDGQYTTYGYYEAYDVSAAIDFLESKNINTEQLGIIGESFGAATSLMAGAIDERIDFVIADSSYTDMVNAVKDNAWRMNSLPHYPIPQLGFLLAGWLVDFNPWSVRPIDSLTSINKPVLLVHCDQDEWAYPKYAYRLYEASNKQLTEFKMFEQCAHVNAYDDYTEEYTRVVEHFLEKHLPEFLALKTQ